MVWEFPAVSQSRIEFWKTPQYTKSGIWWFTLAFGFFGFHHVLLRSPQTAIIFFIANIVTFGYPWIYDLIQLCDEPISGLGTEKLNMYGLGHALGELGIAKGMWLPSKGEVFGEPKNSAQAAPAPPPAPPAPSAPPLEENTTSQESSPSQENTTSIQQPTSLSQIPLQTVPEWNKYPSAYTDVSEWNKYPKKGGAYYDVPEWASAKGAATKTNGTPTNPNGTPTKANAPTKTSKETNPLTAAVKQDFSKDGPPNPWWFLAYFILLPISPLAAAVAGDNYNCLSRFLDLTIIPLGWLFFVCALLYDYWIMLSQPADLFIFGTKRFFPFPSLFGMDVEGHSPKITGKVDIQKCEKGSIFVSLLKGMIAVVALINPALALGLTNTLNTSLGLADSVIDGVAATAIGAAQRTVESVEVATDAIGAVQKIATTLEELTPEVGIQKGGSKTPLDWAAGGLIAAVILGGLMLNTSRIVNGFTDNGKNDLPPSTSRF